MSYFKKLDLQWPLLFLAKGLTPFPKFGISFSIDCFYVSVAIPDPLVASAMDGPLICRVVQGSGIFLSMPTPIIVNGIHMSVFRKEL